MRYLVLILLLSSLSSSATEVPVPTEVEACTIPKALDAVCTYKYRSGIEYLECVDYQGTEYAFITNKI